MLTLKGFNKSEDYNRIIFETNNFKVIPSLGSLVEGWILVIPKKHYISFGAIKDINLFEELRDLLEHIYLIFKKEYGSYIVFEHGPNIEMSQVGCGVDYAHIHIVPIELTLDDVSVFADSNLKWTKASSINNIRNYYNQNQPYLYFQDILGCEFLTTSPEIPSQFFRKIIAKKINKADMYDWKHHFFLGNIERTYNRLSKYQRLTSSAKLTVYG